MDELILEGKLGVEMINPLKGCCADSILAWRPLLIGQKQHCLYCDNPMKTVRAGEMGAPECTGMLNETRFQENTSEFGVGEIWFSEKRFDSPAAVELWCKERGLEGTDIVSDGVAYKAALGAIVADTERAVWAAPGVIAVVGLAKIDTGSMVTGGMLHPFQSVDAKKPEKVEEQEETTEDEEAPVGENCGVAEKALTGFEKSLDQIIS